MLRFSFWLFGCCVAQGLFFSFFFGSVVPVLVPLAVLRASGFLLLLSRGTRAEFRLGLLRCLTGGPVAHTHRPWAAIPPFRPPPLGHRRLILVVLCTSLFLVSRWVCWSCPHLCCAGLGLRPCPFLHACVSLLSGTRPSYHFCLPRPSFCFDVPFRRPLMGAVAWGRSFP